MLESGVRFAKSQTRESLFFECPLNIRSSARRRKFESRAVVFQVTKLKLGLKTI